MRYLATLLVLGLVFSYACQQEVPPVLKRSPFPGIEKGRFDPTEEKYFIKRYEGKLGASDSIPMDMLLVNWGDGKLEGHIYYPKHEGVLKFEGHLKKDQSFELIEERYKERNASFSGKFSGTDRMEGTWWNIDSSKTMLFDFKEYVSPHDHDLWTGTWHLNDPWDTAQLIIGAVTEDHLNFAMNIYINGYTEKIYGAADIRGQRAVMDHSFFEIFDENCHLVFHRRKKEIYLHMESFPFLCDLGPNCWLTETYDDVYKGELPRMNFIGKDSVFLDTAMYQDFYTLVGLENQNKFAYNMERLEKVHEYNMQGKSILTMWKGRVRGFHREKEGIIAYDKNRNMWAATTTPPDSTMGPMKVHYFTNVKKDKKKMHYAIKDWMKHFNNCTIIYEE